MTAYAYIVECSDGSLYSGWTNNLEKRIAAHNAGQGAKYTRARLPVRLRYYETFKEKSDALKREYTLKQMTHAEKMELIGLADNI